MSREVICKVRPEEWELQRKQSELAALEIELAQRELDLARLRTELMVFQDRYLNALGELYSRLDVLQARIARRKAVSISKEAGIREEEVQAGARTTNSTDSKNSTHSAKAGIADTKRQYHFRPAKQLKKLYREVAKRFHPDLAANEKERIRFQKLMADANRAYREGDELRLQTFLHQGEQGCETARGEEYQVRLEWIERRIGLIRERLKALAAEIAAVKRSTLYEMRLKVEEAEKNGIDLLVEMASYLRRQIARAQAELAAMDESCGEGLSA